MPAPAPARLASRSLRGKTRQHRPTLRSRNDGWLDAPLVIAVVSFTKPHPKVPEWEQQLSAGASAMNIVTAATALSRYGANWLTGWFAFDRDVLDGLGLKADEKITGFVRLSVRRRSLRKIAMRPRSAIL